MSVHARVRITVEVSARSAWDDDVTVAQVRKQAGSETTNAVLAALRTAGLSARSRGEPTIYALGLEPKEEKDPQP